MAYTNQSAFDIVAAHIFNQGERAMSSVHSCTYMNKDNNAQKCAIGCLLDDDECEHMDGHEEGDINTLMSVLPHEDDHISIDIYAKLRVIDTDLMVDLQMVHDNEDHWLYTKTMRDELRSLGVKHCLDVSCLEGMHFGDR